MDIPTIPERIDTLFEKFGEPVIQKERRGTWLEQFSVEGRSVVHITFDMITIHSYPRLIREARDLHARIKITWK